LWALSGHDVCRLCATVDLVRAVGNIKDSGALFLRWAAIDPHLFTGEILVTAIIISLLAIVSKVIGCALPLGEGWETHCR
jgi:hypothetical protein